MTRIEFHHVLLVNGLQSNSLARAKLLFMVWDFLVLTLFIWFSDFLISPVCLLTRLLA